MIGKRYLGTVDEAGARKIAHEFAADIIGAFGGKSMFGTHIYFVSSRTGHKEIWVMDPDGKNQRQITHFNSISIEPGVSPDGSKIAFTSYARGTPGIFVFSVDPVRDLRFYNQNASVNRNRFVHAGWKTDHLFFVRAGPLLPNLPREPGWNGFSADFVVQRHRCRAQGESQDGERDRFCFGPFGPAADLQDEYGWSATWSGLPTATAKHPIRAWHPDGQLIAFAWTRGFATGELQHFHHGCGDSQKYVQLTHGEGRNENPSWAPDGVHLGFMSTRTGR